MAIAVVVLAVCLVRCVASSRIPEHHYDWTRLQTTGDLKTYTAKDGTAARLAVDVAYYDGSVDWQALREAGVEIAYVRVGYRGYTQGSIVEDECARANLLGAISAGLEPGIYFFSQAISEAEAVEEADFACDYMDAFGLGSMPVCFDMEYNNVPDERIAGLDTDEKTAIALAFCDEVVERGYSAIIYGNRYWLDGEYDLKTIIKRYPLWLAEYNDVPSATFAFVAWQYDDDAVLPGLDFGIDVNLWFAAEDA